MSDPFIQPEFSTPLQYAEPAPRRPGIITAVGVMSIVIGCLSVLFCLSGIFSGVMYLMMSRGTMFTPPTLTLSSRASSSSSSTAVSTTVVSSGVVTVPTTSTTTTIPVPMPSFGFKVDPRASMLTIDESAASLLVAALLIVAGGLLLRDSPKARPLHRLYVLCKLPLIAVAALATWWTYSSLMSGMASMGASMPMSGFPQIMAVVQASIHALFALAYPVALLIILSTRTSKAYFQRLSDERVR